MLSGEAGQKEMVASPECDSVLAAVTGAAGLPAVVEAASRGKRLCLSNKESLVVAGPDRRQAGPRARRPPCCPWTASTRRFSSACARGAPRARRPTEQVLESRDVKRLDPHRVGRTHAHVDPRAHGARDRRGGSQSPDLENGSQYHRRFRDSHEQGARDHRGALVVPRPARADRRRRPPPVGRPLHGRVRRRLGHGAMGVPDMRVPIQ